MDDEAMPLTLLMWAIPISWLVIGYLLIAP